MCGIDFFLREVQTPPTLMSLASIGRINLFFPLFALNHRDIELLPCSAHIEALCITVTDKLSPAV